VSFASNQPTTKPMNLRHQLLSAVTRYDERQSKRRQYNQWALPQYIARIEDILRDIENGADPAAAIQAGFSGSLATACLKACDLTPTTLKPTGAWAYAPTSERN
jgi:hypothetical protein